jgi:hypothetical protein
MGIFTEGVEEIVISPSFVHLISFLKRQASDHDSD